MHGGVGDAVGVRQRRLDLAELDAEAADLHLVVGAAEVLQVAVGAASGPGRRCGTSGPGAPNGSATNRAAVRPGRSEVAAGELGAGDVQLAGDARRDRAQPASSTYARRSGQRPRR